MKKKRVLLVYSSGGGGLKYLAENLGMGLRRYFGGMVQVDLADPFTETDGFGNLLFCKIYNFFLYRNLAVNSLLVKLSYLTRPNMLPIVKSEVHSSLRRRLDSCDLVICTSPWVLEGIFYSLEQLKRDIPVMVYVADFGEGMHTDWFHKKAAGYLTVTDEAGCILRKHGASPGSVSVLGLPVPHPRKKGRRIRRLSRRILIASSLHGSEEIVHILDSINPPSGRLRIDVLCGTSIDLLKAVSSRPKDISNVDVRAHGFVSERTLFALTEAADLMVTKAGSLSIANAVCASTPMLLIGYPAIMPQERGNARFVVENNIGWLCMSRNEIAERIRQATSDHGMITEKQVAMARLKHFTDTKRICGSIMRRAGFIL